MPELRSRDIVVVAILGEIVGLFAYAIIRAQQFALPVSGAILLLVLLVGVPIAAAVALFIAYPLGRKVHPMIFQFGKFAAVGFSNTAIDWGVFNLLLVPLGFTTSVYVPSKAASFAIATLNSFFWNRFWSFDRQGTAHIGSEAMKFYLFTAAGLGINVAVATFVKEIGPETRLWAGIAAPALATAISMIWNFSAYRFVVFRPSPSPFVPSPKS